MSETLLLDLPHQTPSANKGLIVVIAALLLSLAPLLTCVFLTAGTQPCATGNQRAAFAAGFAGTMDRR